MYSIIVFFAILLLFDVALFIFYVIKRVSCANDYIKQYLCSLYV